MNKRLLMYYGGNTPLIDCKDLDLPHWIPKVNLPFVQSINRVNHTIGDMVNPFKSVIATETIEEIKMLPSNNLSYEDQSHNRAIQIKEKTKDSKLFLMYSGGIDSTTALVSILNTWSKEELERVYILLSYNSIEEFPRMWKLINNNFKGRIINSLTNTDKFIREGYILTGEHGDQIFGSDVIISMVQLYGEDIINSPWQDYMNKFYKVFFYDSSSNIDIFVDKYSMTLPFCPFPIKTCFEFVWWFNFTNKWQPVKYRVFNQKRFTTSKETFKRIIHFFDTPEFQKWSLDNQDLKIKNTLDSYKYTAKEYIVKHTGFEEYLSKPKIGSLQHVGNNFDRLYAIDKDYNEMTREEVKECLNNG